MRENYKRILLLLIPLLAVAFYAMVEEDIFMGEFVVEKADLPWLPQFSLYGYEEEPPDTIYVYVTAEEQAAPKLPRWRKHMEQRGDSVPRILMIGDSMLEGLTRRCADYCMEMGYDMTSVIWYSSNSEIWAQTDTLDYFLKKVDPDYLIICLCANELFVRKLNTRDENLGLIASRLRDYDYIWISPPNWKEDTGINDLIIKNVGKGRYFDSRHLDLDRCKDGAHPTFKAAEGWFDLVADWMQSDTCVSPIPLPEKHAPVYKKRRYRQYILKPFKN